MLLEFICPELWGVANLAPRTNGHRRIAELKIPALVADFCTYYAPHPNKTVIYYYDATALGSNYAVNDQDFHWVVVHEFERNGFRKNKSMEKQPESEEDLLEHRTDGTDTFDTLYTG